MICSAKCVFIGKLHRTTLGLFVYNLNFESIQDRFFIVELRDRGQSCFTFKGQVGFPLFMPPFEDEGHIDLHRLVGMSVGRPDNVHSIS
jgi:hypothetical protein